MNSFLRLLDQPSEGEDALCAQIGYVTALMARSQSHARLDFSVIRTLVTPAIRHRQLKVYFDEDGTPVGYVIWVRVAADVEARFLSGAPTALHESEWNEGNRLWVIDLLAPLGHVRYILRDLRDNVFRDQHCARYFRVKDNRRLVKEVVRDPRLSFFREAAAHA